MKKKQVAVLDVGSSKITVVVGERGINKTFIIKARKDFEYDGFANGEFFDVEALKRTIRSCGEFVNKSIHSKTPVYVGVPGGFTLVTVKDSQISFPKKKRITDMDVDSLFDAAFVLSSTKVTLINRSAIIYELDDCRRLANPVGEVSEVLKGKLSFVTCSNYFIEIFRSALKGATFEEIEFVSTPLAEAIFLLDAETRDRIAIIVDVGYITTTFSLIQGDGILFQSTFGYGGGYITASISQKYNISFDLAEKIKYKISLSAVSSGAIELITLDNGGYYNLDELRGVVKGSLDVLCENISECVEKSGYVIPEYVPIAFTGGGISFIRGAKEHISGRLGCATFTISPKIPLVDKPTESSVYSLLDLAID